MISECRSRRRLQAALAGALLTLGLAATLSPALAQGSPDARRPLTVSDPATLKAAFLYNFALYTSWPPPPPSAMTLCAFGRDELGAAFDALASKQVDGKPVQVRRVDTAAEVKGCHLLYVPESASGNLPGLARSLAAQPVLLVSDAGGLDASMILIETEGSRLVFSVNLTRVRSAGLDVSSKLLRLARAVK